VGKRSETGDRLIPPSFTIILVAHQQGAAGLPNQRFDNRLSDRNIL
jgi:hypothetical protein